MLWATQLSYGTGYTNLVDHLLHHHGATYLDKFRVIQRREGSLDCFVKGDDFSRNVYHWSDWTIMENRALHICEKVKDAEVHALEPVSVQTLKKHMFVLEEVMQARVKNQFAGKQLDLLIDEWTEQDTHFIAVFAVSLEHKSLSTLANEVDMIADAIIELLDEQLDTYSIDAHQLCFLRLRQCVCECFDREEGATSPSLTRSTAWISGFLLV